MKSPFAHLRSLSARAVILVASISVPGLIVGALAQSGAPSTSAATTSVLSARKGLSGVWTVTNFHNHLEPLENRVTTTLEGEPVPLQPWAKAIYEKRLADARAGSVFPDTESFCVTAGVPRMMRGPSYPVEILQTSGQVTFLFEALHTVRRIYLNQKHPPTDSLDYTFYGDEVGHWDGDTLVVDTVGLTDRTTLDKVGLPHSQDLHVIEHIRLTGKDAFEDLITIDDPRAFTKMWSFKATYVRAPRGTRIMESECDEERLNAATAKSK